MKAVLGEIIVVAVAVVVRPDVLE